MSEITVTVNTVRGDHTTVTVPADGKISDLKDAVEKAMNIPAAEQKLIFNGKITQNESTLEECGFFFSFP